MNLYKKQIIVIITTLLLVTITISAYSQNNRDIIKHERTDIWYFNRGDIGKKYEKFISLDNSYYVGYMYKGLSMYLQSTDKIGYLAAITPLEKALRLFEKEFSLLLTQKVQTLDSYLQYKNNTLLYQRDYNVICYALEKCYRYTDNPGKAFQLMSKLAKIDMQKFEFVNPFIQISWIYYRNRAQIGKNRSGEYQFLHDNIDENLKTSLAYLDSANIHNVKNMYLEKIFRYGNIIYYYRNNGDNQETWREYSNKFLENYLVNKSSYKEDYKEDIKNNELAPQYSIWHNKSLIYGYKLATLDSSEFYYNKIKDKDNFNNTNYGIFKLCTGEFESAEEYFVKAKNADTMNSKRVGEHYVWLSQLYINKALPNSASDMLINDIGRKGSTPGYGWNNIALARAEFYNGDIDESLERLTKASNFNEVNIGTTWESSSYDFLINLFKIRIIERAVSKMQFEDRNYLYSYKYLSELPFYYSRKYMALFTLSNRLANNHEREVIFYRIFSNETLTIWDEMWTFMQNYNPDYFIEKMQKLMKTDPRNPYKKYYRYFISKLLIEKGDYDSAKTELELALNDDDFDEEYEKLLTARIHETLAYIYQKTDVTGKFDEHINQFYNTYPQLVPFSESEMSFKLDTSNTSKSIYSTKIIKELKNCNINWLNKTDESDYPTVFIDFVIENKIHYISYKVILSDGTVFIDDKMQIKEYRDDTYKSGVNLAYHLFNING